MQATASIDDISSAGAGSSGVSSSNAKNPRGRNSPCSWSWWSPRTSNQPLVANPKNPPSIMWHKLGRFLQKATTSLMYCLVVWGSHGEHCYREKGMIYEGLKKTAKFHHNQVYINFIRPRYFDQPKVEFISSTLNQPDVTSFSLLFFFSINWVTLFLNISWFFSQRPHRKEPLMICFGISI